VLCVPATDAHRIAKALTSGADEVVIDLEDAVPVSAKGSAREVLAGIAWGSWESLPAVAVRVNAAGTPWCHRDLEAVVSAEPVTSVVLPKVESREDVGFAERLLGGLEAEVGRPHRIAVQALVETAAGLAGLADIVSKPDRLSTLLIGYADLATSLGRRAGSDEQWLPARELVLWHARSAGLAAVDGPHLGVHDDEPFRRDVAGAAALGFDAKWAIHPRQLTALELAFGVTDDQIAHAERVLHVLEKAEGDGRGAVEMDGQLIDEAMALAARRVLAKARRDAS